MNERTLPRAEYQKVKADLNVHFRRFVGEKTGREDLKATPDFMRGESINPDWVASVRPKHKTVATPSPGKLIFTKPGWRAVDPESPIGKIEKLQEQAKILLDQPENPTKKKKAESDLKAELVKIFNSYAGERFNGVRDVVNGQDFTGVSLTNFTSRSLHDWREKLVRTRYQTIAPELFDRWENAPSKNLKTPSQADDFLTKAFREIASSEVKYFTKDTTPPETLSYEASMLTELLSRGDEKGYVALANMFYGGDMKKTYLNFSVITKITGAPFPKSWRAFLGSTSEFGQLQKKLKNVTEEVDGYIKAANDYYGGDMKKTYNNLSAVAKMTSTYFPEGWQSFQGSTNEFRQLQDKLKNITDGIAGYLNAADTLYGGNLSKTYRNFSAVAKMTGAPFSEGWQQFYGSTDEFKIQREWVAKNTTGTIDMFMIHCTITDRTKAKRNLAAIRAMA